MIPHATPPPPIPAHQIRSRLNPNEGMGPAWTARMLRETLRVWFRRAHALRCKVDVLLAAVAKEKESVFRGDSLRVLSMPTFAASALYDDNDWTEEDALVAAEKEKRAAEAIARRAALASASDLVGVGTGASTGAGAGVAADANSGAGADASASAGSGVDGGPASAARRRAAALTEAMFRNAEEKAAALAVAAVQEAESGADATNLGGEESTEKRARGRPKGSRGIRELVYLNAERERLGAIAASERSARQVAGSAAGRSSTDYNKDYGPPGGYQTRRAVPASGPWSNVSTEDRRKAEELKFPPPPTDDPLVGYVIEDKQWKVRPLSRASGGDACTCASWGGAPPPPPPRRRSPPPTPNSPRSAKRLPNPPAR